MQKWHVSLNSFLTKTDYAFPTNLLLLSHKSWQLFWVSHTWKHVLWWYVKFRREFLNIFYSSEHTDCEVRGRAHISTSYVTTGTNSGIHLQIQLLTTYSEAFDCVVQFETLVWVYKLLFTACVAVMIVSLSSLFALHTPQVMDPFSFLSVPLSLSSGRPLDVLPCLDFFILLVVFLL